MYNNNFLHSLGLDRLKQNTFSCGITFFFTIILVLEIPAFGRSILLYSVVCRDALMGSSLLWILNIEKKTVKEELNSYTSIAD
jgi:hypothetical protein